MCKSVFVATKCYSARVCLLVTATWIFACTEPAQPRLKAKAGAFAPVAHADARLKEAREKFHAATQPDESASQLGSACFHRAEFAEDNKKREALANEGIDACRRLIAVQPNGAAGYYYLGMNLGQLAKANSTWAAWRMVKDIEGAFEKARDLDAKYSNAGPDRSLGLLHYHKHIEAPIFYGKDKAREHLERAVRLAPDYPANRLNLLEAYIKWGDAAGINSQRAALRKLLPKARKEFSGDEWATDWLEWDKRWKELGGSPNK